MRISEVGKLGFQGAVRYWQSSAHGLGSCNGSAKELHIHIVFRSSTLLSHGTTSQQKKHQVHPCLATPCSHDKVSSPVVIHLFFSVISLSLSLSLS